MSDYINIGKLVAAHGLTGDLVLKHGLGKKTIFTSEDTIFVEQVKGSYLPYFIAASSARTTDETIVTIEEIDSREKARKFIKKQVWLTQEDFRRFAAKNSPIALLGFMLVNEGEKVGIIEEVIEQPHQVLLTITLNGKEALIPLHEETLNTIDYTKKEVYVTLPDGLLEIYLEE